MSTVSSLSSSGSSVLSSLTGDSATTTGTGSATAAALTSDAYSVLLSSLNNDGDDDGSTSLSGLYSNIAKLGLYSNLTASEFDYLQDLDSTDSTDNTDSSASSIAALLDSLSSDSTDSLYNSILQYDFYKNMTSGIMRYLQNSSSGSTTDTTGTVDISA